MVTNSHSTNVAFKVNLTVNENDLTVTETRKDNLVG